jgi:hypothetical protein
MVGRLSPRQTFMTLRPPFFVHLASVPVIITDQVTSAVNVRVDWPASRSPGTVV